MRKLFENPIPKPRPSDKETIYDNIHPDDYDTIDDIISPEYKKKLDDEENMISNYPYDDNYKFDVYETNIDPLLRFIHERNLPPSGWVRINRSNIKSGHYSSKNNRTLELSCSYQFITPILDEPISSQIAPFTICSFDGEMNSITGDFPTANKDYSKLSGELAKKCLETNNYIDCEQLQRWIQFVFSNKICYEHYSPLPEFQQLSRICTEQCTKSNQVKCICLNYESTRVCYECINENMQKIPMHNLLNICDTLCIGSILNIKNTFKPYQEKLNELTEAFLKSLNLECPKIQSDEIIQIGNVFQRFGEPEPYLKHIIIQKEADPIPGITIQACANEYDLLTEWRNLLLRESPNITIGYNTYGFDWPYIYQRIAYNECDFLLDIAPFKQTYTKLKPYDLNFLPQQRDDKKVRESTYICTDKNDKQSMMGYMDIPGSYHVDIMNVVKGEHKLDVYKLDAVAAHFIKGMILSYFIQNDFGITYIQTNNVFGMKVNDWIIFQEADIIPPNVYFQKQRFEIIGIIPNSSKTFVLIVKGMIHLNDLETFQFIDDNDNDNDNDNINMYTNFIPDISWITMDQHSVNWGVVKDDLSPAELFRKYLGSNADRRDIAKYCIQDCQLTLTLFMKLDILLFNISMSNVCYIPIDFLFTRGQGIKVLSLMSKHCRDEKYLIPYQRHTLPNADNDDSDDDGDEEEDNNNDSTTSNSCISSNRWVDQDIRGAFSGKRKYTHDLMDSTPPNYRLQSNKQYLSQSNNTKTKRNSTTTPTKSKKNKEIQVLKYEGAYVINPKSGIYPYVITWDYNSLYPSCIMSENLAHEMHIINSEYMGEVGRARLEKLGFLVNDIIYDNYVYFKSGKKIRKELNLSEPGRLCRFIYTKMDENGQIIPSTQGILPKIVSSLLQRRKDVRKLQKKVDKNSFEWKVYEGQQLAFKKTANSFYGSVGASVNPIYYRDVAACTTQTGKKMLLLARDTLLTKYPDTECVYGDTDSVFFNIPIQYVYNENHEIVRPYTDEEMLQYCCVIGKEGSAEVAKYLRHPHNLEFEKILKKLKLFKKKKYSGMKITPPDIIHYDLLRMGLFIIRRDSAPIARHLGSMVDILLTQTDNILDIYNICQREIIKILEGEYPLKYFIMTKQLKSNYANPNSIAHKVLADRIGIRDAGNKPNVGDRIQFVYFINPNKNVTLLGERIETPDYLIQNNLQIDYLYYIEHQIMNPISQLMSLVLEKLPGYNLPKNYWNNLPNQDSKKIETARINKSAELIFDKLLISYRNRQYKKQHIITDFLISR